ncbi:acyl-CoA synthetase [Spongiibacter tropicus]|uniref:acyl-CoA synthetase n=1 Tax=Spongiibacter tropicus TaxID=454602 RepID=UPI0035BE9212
MTIVQHPQFHAQKQPQKAACILANTGEVMTYAELDALSNQLAQLFYNCGLRAGDHIAYQMENSHCFLQIAWAAQRSGLVFTPLHSHLRPAEVAYILENSGAKLFICSPRYLETAQQLDRSTLPAVQHWFISAGEAPDFDSLQAAMGECPSVPLAQQCAGVPMLYSSGTTGQPKGIKPSLPEQTFDEVPAVMQGIAAFLGINSESTYLTPAPLYHAAPMHSVMAAMALGGTVVMMDGFDPELSLQAIEKYRVDCSQWVPIMFIRLLKLPEAVRSKYDLSSLKAATHAAAPCPADVKRKMIEWWGPIINEYYAASEGIGMTAIDSAQWLAHPGSVGQSLMGEVHIVDDDGNELPCGETGMIYFSGFGDFEYHNEPEKTAGAHHREGWATVGDMGYVDDEGYLYLADRRDFMIISGGVNIYPQEVENTLIAHPEVADVAVFGLPDEEFGERVVAVVQPEQGCTGNAELADRLRSWCRESVSALKCPKEFFFEAQLPRKDNGKMYKKPLQEKYRQAAAVEA